MLVAVVVAVLLLNSVVVAGVVVGVVVDDKITTTTIGPVLPMASGYSRSSVAVEAYVFCLSRRLQHSSQTLDKPGRVIPAGDGEYAGQDSGSGGAP